MFSQWFWWTFKSSGMLHYWTSLVWWWRHVLCHDDEGKTRLWNGNNFFQVDTTKYVRKLEFPLQSCCKNLVRFIKCKPILKLHVKQVWSGASSTPRKSKKWRKLSSAAPPISQPQAQEGWNISGFWLVHSHCLCVMWRQHGEVCIDNKS